MAVLFTLSVLFIYTLSSLGAVCVFALVTVLLTNTFTFDNPQPKWYDEVVIIIGVTCAIICFSLLYDLLTYLVFM